MTNPEIKPCPFCGGKGEISEDLSSQSRSRWYYVVCDSCCAKSDVVNSEAEAILDWNRRIQEMKRVPVNVFSCKAEYGERYVAVCEDGSIWLLSVGTEFGSRQWVRLPDIPKEEAGSD